MPSACGRWLARLLPGEQPYEPNRQDGFFHSWEFSVTTMRPDDEALTGSPSPIEHPVHEDHLDQAGRPGGNGARQLAGR